ncbi:MAG: tetratricopeptide repeat protein [Candidatus Cloacimonetes bacterium]|nr:tetratricopeptide repeat protein [Candidatus Cloacimonadota bacterium]MCF7813084.1 tetratricopeptide repeat protein [Candidatus Cloacimonadota bacterium]MCF7867533.1 tetratricopeptide repeat protein [Candidatus Cloacimonadota bacterium]MCF7883073.1 tetratricopeptide repeat protein [Candidatus Cloacimonadota bacterium]
MLKQKFILILLLLSGLLICTPAAIDSLKSVLKTAEGRERVDILHLIAQTLSSSDIEEAKKYIAEAEQLSRELDYQIGLAETWNIRGQIAYRKGDYEAALENYTKSLKIFESLDHKKGMSKIYNNLGLISINLGKFEEARDYQLASIEIKKQLDDWNGISSSLTNLGLIYWKIQDYGTAIDYLEQSLEIQKTIGDNGVIANTKNNIAIAYLNLNHYDKALEYFLKAIKAAEEIGNSHIVASCLNNIGIVYAKMKLYDEAIPHHLQALEIFLEMGDKPNIANTYNNLGLAYQYKNDYENALEYLSKALQMSKESEDLLGITNSLNNIGSIYEDKQDYPAAIRHYQESMQINKERDQQWNIALDHSRLGRVYLRMKNLEQAEKHLLAANQKFQDQDIHDDYIGNLLNLAELYSMKNQYQKAYNHLMNYITVSDTISSHRNLEKTNELKIKYDLETKEVENDLLKKDLEIINMQKKHLLYVLIAALIIITLVIIFLISSRRMNKKLKHLNIALTIAKQEAERNEKQILLINKMLRHDITNNLAVVVSAIRLYQKEQDKSYLDEAAKKCNIGIELIKNLHSMERKNIDFEHRHPINLEKILDKIINDNSEINISYKGSAVVLADDSIESVFRNLIENAVNHGQAKQIEISILEVNNICEIRVFNDGRQIDEEVIDKIFEEKFSHGKNGNTGLGLYLVKQNVQRYGGSIYVENTPPSGVTFILSLKKA